MHSFADIEMYHFGQDLELLRETIKLLSRRLLVTELDPDGSEVDRMLDRIEFGIEGKQILIGNVFFQILF